MDKSSKPAGGTYGIESSDLGPSTFQVPLSPPATAGAASSEDDEDGDEFDDAIDGDEVPRTSSKVLLDQDSFRTETSTRLFDAIDELRRYGAGKELNLPQVCRSSKEI